MRRTTLFLVAIALLLRIGVAHSQGQKSLDIYFIDTEGGLATLVVSPSGESMLIDTGYFGFDSPEPLKDGGKYFGRDAERILAAAKRANLRRIDTVVITHQHTDHVGGSRYLAERIPIGSFVDHGPSVEDYTRRQFIHQGKGEYGEEYTAAIAVAKAEHKVVAAGDKVPMKGLDVTVMIASGKPIERKGTANPYCEGIAPRPDQPSEDAQSVGVLVQFGKFRFANLGDMPWNGEVALLCPENRMGKLDVYNAAGHGREPSTAVSAMEARVAVLPNGPRKGAGPAALKAFQALRGLEDVWQMHFNVPAGTTGNPPDQFIANIGEAEECPGMYLKLSAMEDGSFTMYNARSRTTKTYAAK